MKITEKLPRDAFKDDEESHILLGQQICHTIKNDSAFMPAPQTFTPSTKKERGPSNLPDGTCRIACVYGSVEWKYPKSGLGVQYRFG